MRQTKIENRTKLHICINLAVMLFIFIQSAMPGEMSGAESNIIAQFIAGLTGWNEEVLSILVRKAAHFTEYAVLGICLSINMRDLQMNLACAWIIGTAYAATDEFHQLFVPDRAGTLTDVLIDSAGVACGILVYVLFRQVRNKKCNL